MKLDSVARFLIKLVALFTIIRGYVLAVLFIAMYLAAIFIFSDSTIIELLKNRHLFLFVIANIISVASGFIINDFYDQERDLINRPLLTSFQKNISVAFKLRFAFTLWVIASLLCCFISIKAVVFIIGFQLLQWLYSHKIIKFLIWSDFLASVLAIFPFLGLFLFFKVYDDHILLFAAYLFVLLWWKENFKSGLNWKGDTVVDYGNILNTSSIKKYRWMIHLLSFSLLLIISFLILQNNWTGSMSWYFKINIFVLITTFVLSFYANRKELSFIGYNLLRFSIFSGVFSIPLLKF